MSVYDINGNLISGGVSGEIPNGSITPEKTTFVDVENDVSEISSGSIRHNDSLIHSTDSNMYGSGFKYGAGNIISINVEAGKTYMLMGLNSNLTATMNTRFSTGRSPVGEEPMAIKLNADGTLGEVVYDFLPEYVSLANVDPYGTTGMIVSGKNVFWSGEYNELGTRTGISFVEAVDGTDYAWCVCIFTANINFCGIVQWGGFSILDENYFRIYEVDPNTEYNPYFDGVLNVGEKRINSVLNDEIMKNSLKKNNVEMLSTYNTLYGKRWYAAGDSLTQYAGGRGVPNDETDTGFVTQIMRRTGVIGVNGGKAGLKWSSGTDGEFETGSAVDRVNTIINGTDMYDIVTFAYGTNSDVDGEGTVDDAPAYDGTMCSAIKWCIEKLVEWNPDIQIGIILPPKRADMGDSGNQLMKTRGDLIRQVAEMYGVPCCDMWAESGINLMHYTNPDTGNEKYYYLSDMLHLSDRGKIKYANRLKSFLETLANVY